MRITKQNSSGSTIILALIVIIILSVCGGAALLYTQSIARNVQRTTARQQAIALGNGALDRAFQQFRATCKEKENIALTGSAFGLVAPDFPDMFGAQASPGSYLNTGSNSPLIKYRIDALNAADPTRTPLAPSATPGQSQAQSKNMPAYSYLASADVNYRTVSGTATAKVRRIFQKVTSSPWQYAIFYNDDLEINPGATYDVNGWVHTNANFYTGGSNGNNNLNFSGKVDYTGGWKASGEFSPNDKSHGGANPKGPTESAGIPPPAPGPAQLPQNSDLLTGTRTPPAGTYDPENLSGGFHELIERPASSDKSMDPLFVPDPDDPTRADPTYPSQRYYYQAGAKILISSRTSSSSTRTVTSGTTTTGSGKSKKTTITNTTTTTNTTTLTRSAEILNQNGDVVTAASTGNDLAIFNAFDSAIVKSPDTAGATRFNGSLLDSREGPTANTNPTPPDTSASTSTVNGNTTTIDVTEVKNVGVGMPVDQQVTITTIDVSKIQAALDSNPSLGAAGCNVVYVSDMTSTPTSLAGIELINGYKMPNGGLTVVSDNPIYIKGDYNASNTPPNASSPKVNSNKTPSDPTKPYETGYVPQPCAVMGDAVTILSNNWKDTNSANNPGSNTTINTAILSGNVTAATRSGQTFTYSGGAENFPRLLENWGGKTFTYYGSMVQLFQSKQATGVWNGNHYGVPRRQWYFDTNFYGNPPPGTLKIINYVKSRSYVDP